MYGLTSKNEISAEMLFDDMRLIDGKNASDLRYQQTFGFSIDSEENARMTQLLTGLKIFNAKQRPTGLQGLVDGILMGEGYSFCDIHLAVLLEEGKNGTFAPNSELTSKLKTGTLELTESKLELLTEIRNRQKQLGREFAERYKDPDYLASFTANGCRGLTQFDLAKELEAHTGKPFTPAAYHELISTKLGMYQVYQSLTPYLTTYQQVVQTTEPTLGSTLRHSPGTDYERVLPSIAQSAVFHELGSDDNIRFNRTYTRFVQPYLLSKAASFRQLPLFIQSDDAHSLSPQDAEEIALSEALIRDLEDNIGKGTIADMNGGPAHLFYDFNTGKVSLPDESQERESAARLTDPVNSGFRPLTPEAKERVLHSILSDTPDNKAFIEHFLKEAREHPHKTSVWSSTREEWDLMKGLPDDFDSLSTRFKNVSEFINTTDLLSAEEKESYRRRLDEQLTAFKAIHPAIPFSQIEGKKRLISALKNDQTDTMPFKTQVQMSPAMRASIEDLKVKREAISNQLHTLHSSEPNTASYSGVDQRDLLEMFPSPERINMEDIPAATQQFYRDFYSENRGDHNRALDALFDELDSFEPCSLNLSCLKQAVTGNQTDENGKSVLSDSEKDLFYLLNLMRKSQSFAVKANENPGYIDQRYPTAADKYMFDLKIDTLCSMSGYLTMDFLASNGFDQNLSPAQISPMDVSSTMDSLLENYRLSAKTMVTGVSKADSMTFTVPYDQQIDNGRDLIRGKSVPPQCIQQMKRTYQDIVPPILANTTGQKRLRNIQYLDDTCLTMIDGIPATRFFSEQIKENPGNLDAFIMSALMSGEHRVEVVRFGMEPSGTIKPQIVSIRPDMKEYDRAERSRHFIFFGKTSGQKANLLWEKDEDAETRHAQILDYVQNEIQKKASIHEVEETLSNVHRDKLAEFDPNLYLNSPEFSEYKEVKTAMDRELSQAVSGLKASAAAALAHVREFESQVTEYMSLIEECNKCEDLSREAIRQKLEKEIAAVEADPDRGNKKIQLYSRLYVGENAADIQEELQNQFRQLFLNEEQTAERKDREEREFQENLLHSTRERVDLEAEVRLIRRNLDMKPERDVTPWVEDFSKRDLSSEQIVNEIQKLDISLELMRDDFNKVNELESLVPFVSYLAMEDQNPAVTRWELRKFANSLTSFTDTSYLTQEEKQNLDTLNQTVSRILSEPEDAPITFLPNEPIQEGMAELASRLKCVAEETVMRKYEEHRKSSGLSELPKGAHLRDTYHSMMYQRDALMEIYTTKETPRLQEKLERQVSEAKRPISFSSLLEQEKPADSKKAPQKQEAAKEKKEAVKTKTAL